MESDENLIDPDNEVKKLQELVKKLEQQNEVLRSKQKLSLDSLPNGDAKSPLTHNNNHQAESPSDSMKDKSAEGGFEDVDVLDVDNLSLKDDEDSWLYSSPKPPTPQQTTINLYKWVRQDFDNPSPEVETARRSLLSKLDEAARNFRKSWPRAQKSAYVFTKLNRSSSTPALGSEPSPTKTLTPLSRSTEESQKPFTRPLHKQSLLANAGNRIDNGTFTRPKKSGDRPGPMLAERDRGEDPGYHQHDGHDVQILAKQQEDSLRQSMVTYTSPKRVLQNKSMSMASGDTDNSGSPVGSNRSSPARYDHEGSYIGRHRNSFGSDTGTPPDSPRTLQQSSTPYSDGNQPRRSLGNMSRLQYPPPSSHSSDSSLDHGSMDDLNYAPETRSNSRLAAPGGYRSASPSVGALRAGPPGARGASPQRSGLPTPRRGIPRPATASASASGTRSSLPQPRRSGIPSPRPPSAQGRETDSWREGCF